jgi:hypothetical protein
VTSKTVQTHGLDLLRDRVEEMSGRMQRMPRATEGRLHGYVLLRNEERFASQNATEGRKWANYSREPLYRAFKQSVLGDLTVLRWKGGKEERLYTSLTNPAHPEHVHRVTRDTVEVGTTVPYARRLLSDGKNQFGEIRSGRDFITLGERSRLRLVQLLTVYLVRGESHGNEWRKRP